MRNYFENLSQREQMLIIVAGSFIILLLVYLFLVSPLTNKIQILKQEVKAQNSLLEWMQVSLTELKLIHNKNIQNPEQISTQDLLSVTDESLKTNMLKQYVASFTQGEQNQVVIKFKAVPFDNLMRWFTSLWRKYQIKVIQMSVTPQQKSGLVQADVVLGLNNV